MKENGFEEDEINVVTQIPDYTVKRILEEEKENYLLAKQHWEEKIPVIRDIVGMGLHGIKETLKEMKDPDIRRAMITKMSDLSALTKMVTDLNMLLRLEEGKSTQNVAVNKTYQDTRIALQNLAKLDPVFQYEVGEKGEPEKQN